jgi:hypothetical protein
VALSRFGRFFAINCAAFSRRLTVQTPPECIPQKWYTSHDTFSLYQLCAHLQGFFYGIVFSYLFFAKWKECGIIHL